MLLSVYWPTHHQLAVLVQRRYCYYNETQNILGNTYGMCVLQVC